MTQTKPTTPLVNHNDLDDELIERIYGPWQGLGPQEVMALLGEAPFPWWVAGGWAVEAATGRKRRHWDTDVVVLLRDLDGVRQWLSDYHLWEVHEGSMRPLLPGDTLTPGREQLWLRREATPPWLLDLLLTPSQGDDWLYKRDHSVRRPLADIGHTVDGVPYLKPSVVLLFKAKAHRPKDDRDLESVLAVLSEGERVWLAEALKREKPDHPWLNSLRSSLPHIR